VRTPAGEDVRLGSTVCVYAPRGQPAFLAQVVALWENESDRLKQYQCRWFFRPNQALQASALQEACKLQHPREVFLSDEFDTQYVNTIEGRTIVVHRDLLPKDFNLDSLRVGGHFFYRSKYTRQTRIFTQVKAPGAKWTGATAKWRSNKGSKGVLDGSEVLVLQEDLDTLLANAAF
jgi:hypothetical protein